MVNHQIHKMVKKSKMSNTQKVKNVKMRKRFAIKNPTSRFRPKNRVPWYPLELKNARTRRLGKRKVSKSAIYLTFWPFWGFWLFSLFTFVFLCFCVFSLFLLLHFVTFYTFSVFLILLFFVFCWFWSFFVIFYCWHQFWSFFVSKLSASVMTHFLSSKPALPLSPFW